MNSVPHPRHFVPARSFAPLAALLALLLVVAAPARAAMTIEDVTSPKGIHAWLVEDYSVPIVTIRFAFAGGSSQDPAGKEGMANLMTTLFDEGAGDLDSEAFQEKLDDSGAEMSFDDSRDQIFGTMRMLASEKDAAFDLLRLAVEKPRFDPDPVERMRGQVIADIESRERSPNTKARVAMAKALYGDHPYARRSEGTVESLKAITPADLKAFHSRLFARNNLHVAVVGAIDAKELKAVLDKVFGNLPEKADLTPVPDIQPKLDQTVTVSYPLPQTTLQLVYPGVKRDAPDFFAAYMMNQILGGGTFSSWLFHEVREKRGLAYGVSSDLIDYRHADALVIGTATRSESAPETLQVIREQVKKMIEEGPDEAELDAAKKYVVGAFAIANLDSSVSIARTLVGLQIDHLGIDYIQKREGLIDRVTLDQVKAAAKKLLSAKPALLIVGKPFDPDKLPGNKG
jgi:zinc protease